MLLLTLTKIDLTRFLCGSEDKVKSPISKLWKRRAVDCDRSQHQPTECCLLHKPAITFLIKKTSDQHKHFLTFCYADEDDGWAISICYSNSRISFSFRWLYALVIQIKSNRTRTRQLRINNKCAWTFVSASKHHHQQQQQFATGCFCCFFSHSNVAQYDSVHSFRFPQPASRGNEIEFRTAV